MKKILSSTFVFLTFCLSTYGGIVIRENSANHSVASLQIEGDSMNWIIAADGSQYPWVTEKYGWGLGYLSQDGVRHDWKYISKDNGEPVYKAGDIYIRVARRIDKSGDMHESYLLENRAKRQVKLSDIGIYTPLNDNYPDARTCMTSRCNAHIWAGGDYAYIDALRMSGKGPHLGLLVTEGSIADYEIWQRGNDKGWSNFRGVIALNLPDMILLPGKSYRLSWRVFEHNGSDFDRQILRRGGVIAESDKYVYEVGEKAKVRFRLPNGKTKTVSRKALFPGEQEISYVTSDGKTAAAAILCISSERQLIDKRISFILSHQQMLDTNDLRYGAFMVYDNEGDSILTDCQGRPDLDEGRERVGMGVLLAEYYKTHHDEAVMQALTRYATFIREKLQDNDYNTTSSVSRHVDDRGYNYPWVADFYFRMYQITGRKQYAADGYNTLKALYRRFGHGFYCIDYPVTAGLDALSKAGMTAERDSLLSWFRQTADIFVRNGLNFPKFEVNYEQSIIAPAVQFLCEVYLVTDDSRYLKGAETLMPALEAFNGSQPSYRLNDIAIRHWDGYWFGKRQTYGDVFPHYWSCVTAAAFHYYSIATGKTDYQLRAENIVRNNMCQFYEDGRATCAFVYPRRIDGKAAHYADAYANDQDWALVFYLLVNQ